MKRSFKVTLDIPKGARISDARSYIEEWVQTGCGACRPPGGLGDGDLGDPMWGLDRDSVTVSEIRKPRKAP